MQYYCEIIGVFYDNFANETILDILVCYSRLILLILFIITPLDFFRPFHKAYTAV